MRQRLVEVPGSEKPGIRFFRDYYLFGVQKSFTYEIIDNSGNVVENSVPFKILHPTRKKLIDKGRYSPHQSTQEKARRLRRLKT